MPITVHSPSCATLRIPEWLLNLASFALGVFSCWMHLCRACFVLGDRGLRRQLLNKVGHEVKRCVCLRQTQLGPAKHVSVHHHGRYHVDENTHLHTHLRNKSTDNVRLPASVSISPCCALERGVGHVSPYRPLRYCNQRTPMVERNLARSILRLQALFEGTCLCTADTSTEWRWVPCLAKW